MRIPQIRERLVEIAQAQCLPELEFLADQLTRRRFGQAKRSSKAMTPELKEAIRAYHRAHHPISQAKVALVFNVNPGRVSEALRGFRS